MIACQRHRTKSTHDRADSSRGRRGAAAEGYGGLPLHTCVVSLSSVTDPGSVFIADR